MRRGREQRLHLGQHRALAFHHAGDAGAGRVVRAAGKQHFRWIRHFDKAFAAHLEYTDLIRRAKAVFCRAQDAVAHVCFAFEVQHAVDHVLQYLRACDRALPFGELHQFHRTGAHLRHAARGRFQRILIERLNGVDDQNVRLFLFNGLQYIAKAGLRQDIQLVRLYAKAVGAQLELTRRFFAGNIQDLSIFAQLSADLQHQSGFSDARRAADEHERALHGAPAQHAVQLPHAGGKTNLLRGIQLADGARLRAQCAAAPACLRLDGVADALLHERVPRAAARAAARPFWRFVAAFGAEKYAFCLCHIVNLFCFTVLAATGQLRLRPLTFADSRRFLRAPFRSHCSKNRTRSKSRAQ